MKFAFLIHPIGEGTNTLMDLKFTDRLKNAWGQDSLLFCARYHEALQEIDGPKKPSHEVRIVDALTGIHSPTGATTEGRLYEIPMNPRQFIEQSTRAVDLMTQAVSEARKWGAELVGLGGLTGIVGGRGVQLSTEANIAITTGNCLTVYAALQSLYNVCNELEIDLANEPVAVVGIPGSIGTATAHLLANQVGSLVLVARRQSSRARKLAADIGAELLLDIPAALQRCRLVVTATSTGMCIDQRWLRAGSIVVDVAVPTDVVGATAERDDVLILSGGQAKLPSTVSEESGFLWFNHGMIPSCLGETIVLALDGRAESYSLGRNLEPDKVIEIGMNAETHGFDFTNLRSFGLPLADSMLAAVRKVLHRPKLRLADDKSPTHQPGGSRSSESVTDLGSNGKVASGRAPHHRFNGQLSCEINATDTDTSNKPAAITTAAADRARTRYRRHINPVLMELTSSTDFCKTFVRGEGLYLWDQHGTRYLDFVAGYGSVNLGHNHPAVVAALQQAIAQQAPGFAPSSVNPFAAALAEQLVAVTPGGLEMVFFTNSGTESVEAALKLARKATGRERFVSCERSYHGKSMGSLSVTGNRAYQQPFAPLLNGCRSIPFGDLEALERTLAADAVAAFIVEPIQGEGGFHVPHDDYLHAAQTLCHRYGTLLILDEVQTGFGRTGHMFAADASGIQPDIMTLAKSLGGGAVPIGAMVCRKDLWIKAYGTVHTYLLHTTTFGGGSLACAAGLATIDALKDGALLGNAAARGGQLRTGLQRLCKKTRTLREVRGQGLMLGLEFNPMADAAVAHWKQVESTRLTGYLVPGMDKMLDSMSSLYVMQALLNEHHVHTQVTRSDPLVLRVQPPLTVTSSAVEEFLTALETCIRQIEFRGATIQDVIAKTGVGRHDKTEVDPTSS